VFCVQNNSCVSANDAAILHSLLSQKILLSNLSDHRVAELTQHIPHSAIVSSLTKSLYTSPLSSPSTTSCGATDSRSSCQPLFDFHGAVESGNDVSASSAKYKTELCRAFEEHGHCRYGNKCQFAHGKSELRTLNRHPKYKTDLCYTFHTTGFCPYGMRCHFIHNEEERRRRPASQRSPLTVSEHQHYKQQRINMCDDSLGPARQNTMHQATDDELVNQKLVLQLRRVLMWLNEQQTKKQSQCEQFCSSSDGQSYVDDQRFCQWTRALPVSSSVFNVPLSDSSVTSFTFGRASPSDVREPQSQTSPVTADVFVRQSPIQTPIRDSPTGGLSPPPGLPPLPSAADNYTRRNLSCDELIASASAKLALRSSDISAILDLVQSRHKNSAA
jgi:butyrate response factor